MSAFTEYYTLYQFLPPGAFYLQEKFLVYYNNSQNSAASDRKDLPKFFAAQDFDVTTTLLYFTAGGAVRLQDGIVKGNLKMNNRVHRVPE